MRDEDLDEISSLLSDADALALWGEPLDLEGARRWIERNLARYQKDGRELPLKQGGRGETMHSRSLG